MGKHSGDPRDADIARRVRALRLQRGLSQTALGSALGVTFQQVQKYESGTNRISAGRLYRIAQALDAPIPFFYASDEERRSKREPRPCDVETDFLQNSGAMRLIRAYSRITDRDTQRRLLRLTESLAAR
jgi:transcriptional regulator with XRE-family HTH domain